MANTATREKIEECFMLFDQECTGELTVGKFHTVSGTFNFLFDHHPSDGLSGLTCVYLTAGGQSVGINWRLPNGKGAARLQ